MHLNIILPYTPGSSKWSLSLRFPHPNPVRTSPSYVLHASPILCSRILFGEQYRSLSSSLCSFIHSPVTSSLVGPNILLKTLFPNTLNLRSSLSVSDQVSPPYKITDKIIVLYILIFCSVASYRFTVIAI